MLVDQPLERLRSSGIDSWDRRSAVPQLHRLCGSVHVLQTLQPTETFIPRP
jgi:hypothetical protein